MPMENRDRVVMGFPVDHFWPPPPRYEEPTTVTATSEPLPQEKLHLSVKWLILTSIVILFLFLSLGLFFYLRHQSRAPVIQIESITPSNVTSSNSTTISTNWHLTFSLRNPNRYASIHYRMIQVSVSDKDKRLSSGNLDYFYQDKTERGHISVEIFGLVLNLEKQKMNDAGEIMLSLKLDAMVWLETEYMKNRWQVLEASCGDVRVRPSMNLTLDGSGRCNVNLQ
ncbi:hypothetical protein PTKIN_Ptkin02bG0197800 [Pterospermum kingtungense]